MLTQDYGYGSVRSTSSTAPYSRVETIDWNRQQSEAGDGQSSKNSADQPVNGPPQPPPVDIGLVLKLQQKLKDVQSEKERLIQMVEDLERYGPEESTRALDTFKVTHSLIGNKFKE